MSVSRALGNPFAPRNGEQPAAFYPPPNLLEPEPDDDEPDDDDDGEGVTDAELLAEALPPAWDWFEVDPVKLREKKDNGHPIRIRRVRFQRVGPGRKKTGIPGDFDATIVNRAWLLQNHGAGKYLVSAVNSKGHYIVAGQIVLGAPGAIASGPSAEWHGHPGVPPAGAGAVPVVPGGPPGPQDPYAHFNQQIMTLALQRMLNGSTPQQSAPPQDPIREAMAANLKLMQMQLMQQNMQAQNAQQSRALDPITEKLFDAMLKDKQQSKRRSDEPSSIEQAFQLITLGMQLKDQIQGGGDGESEPPWMDLLKLAVDRMGPGTVSLMGHAFLPEQHAAAVDQMIGAAQKAEPEGENGS